MSPHSEANAIPNTASVSPTANYQFPGLLTTTTTRATSRVSIACEACKVRKTKCSGGPPPCKICKNNQTVCVFDASRDGRRRVAYLRASNDSKSYLASLNYLIACIREGPSPHLDAIFDAIKNGATSQEIVNGVQVFLDDSEEKYDTMPDVPKHVEFQWRENLQEVVTMEETTDEAGYTAQEDSDGSHRGTSSLNPGQQVLQEQMGVSIPSDGIKPARNFFVAHQSHLNAIRAPESVARIQSIQPLRQSPDHKIDFTQAESGINGTEFSGQTTVQPQSVRSALQRPSAEFPTDSGAFLVSSTTIDPSASGPYIEPMASLYVHPQDTTRHLVMVQEDHLTRQRIPRHLLLPLILPHHSPRSRTYTDYWQGARRMLESGVPPISVLGLPDKTVVDLFFRPREEKDTFDCASWACEICRSYGTDEFVQLATIHLLTTMMRWLLMPTLEAYQRVPDMMKPTPTQCMVAHFGDIDTIPLPPVRDALILKPRNWLDPLITARCSVNWEEGLDAAVERDVFTGGIVLTQRFVEHVTNYDNWIVGREFLREFPEVTGHIRLHDN